MEHGWFWKILVQGIVVAMLIALAASLSWFPVKLFFATVAAYVLFFLTRNPRFFWRRAFQAALVGAILPPSLAIRARGGSGDEWGIVDLVVDLHAGLPAGSWILIAALCLAADLLLGYWEFLRRRETYQLLSGEAEAELVSRAVGSDLIRAHASLCVASDTSLRGGTLRIQTLWSRLLKCRVKVSQGEFDPFEPAAPASPVRLSAETLAELTVEADLPGGLYRKWIRFRTRTRIGSMFGLRAVVNLKSGPTLEPLQIIFDRAGPD